MAISEGVGSVTIKELGKEEFIWEVLQFIHLNSTLMKIEAATCQRCIAFRDCFSKGAC